MGGGGEMSKGCWQKIRREKSEFHKGGKIVGYGKGANIAAKMGTKVK